MPTASSALPHIGSSTVLVVEDADDLRMLAVRLLEQDGHRVLQAGDGETALQLARIDPPDVVVLDIALPGMDGVTVCGKLREFTDAYVVMVTSRDDDAAKVAAFEAGADDYVTKPFSARELLARVHAMLRRPRMRGTAVDRAVRLGPVEVDPVARRAEREGEPIHLTKTEWSLLLALLASPGVALSRQSLLERVWGPNWFGDDHVVDVHMSNLRRKLGQDRGEPLVTTVRGYGYRLDAVA